MKKVVLKVRKGITSQVGIIDDRLKAAEAASVSTFVSELLISWQIIRLTNQYCGSQLVGLDFTPLTLQWIGGDVATTSAQAYVSPHDELLWQTVLGFN